MTKVVDFNQARKKQNNTSETPSDAPQADFSDIDYSKVDELQSTWLPTFMDMLDEAEIGDDSPEFWQLYAIWGEAFRAILSYDQGLPHPFQQLAEKMVNVTIDGDGSAILEFKPDLHLYVLDEPLIDEDDQDSPTD
jgi:hypothetical protein